MAHRVRRKRGIREGEKNKREKWGNRLQIASWRERRTGGGGK